MSSSLLENLPLELLFHVISFTGVTGPARDLNLDNKASAPYEGFCCGHCGGPPVDPNMQCEVCYKVLEDIFENRPGQTKCECYVLSHPLLAVNRFLREITLEYIYEKTTFEIGPAQRHSWDYIAESLKALHNIHLGKIKLLNVLTYVEEEVFKPDMEFWHDLFTTLRRKFTHPDVCIKILIGCHGDPEEVRLARDTVRRFGMEDKISVESRSDLWFLWRLGKHDFIA